MQRFNVFTADAEYADGPDGYRVGTARLGHRIGATKLAGTVWELPPGQSNCPYHYEYSNEEWLVVLDGRPTVRRPEGEEELAPGDVVCFPAGPAGAHQVTNRSVARARVLIVSTVSDPLVVVFPDSDKIAVWAGDGEEDLIARRRSSVDYWEGEV